MRYVLELLGDATFDLFFKMAEPPTVRPPRTDLYINILVTNSEQISRCALSKSTIERFPLDSSTMVIVEIVVHNRTKLKHLLFKHLLNNPAIPNLYRKGNGEV